MPDTTGLLISLAISAAIGAAAVVEFAGLMTSLITNRETWRSSGGTAFTPLQEMIQPQVRHVAHVAEQQAEKDESGTPPE